MKKTLSLLLAAIMLLATLAGCAGTPAESSPSASPETAPESAPAENAELQKIIIGASPTPHAEILALVKELLTEQGYALEIKEFTDYVQPNVALQDGQIDANFFQHQPYLDDFNAEKGTDLVSLAAVHYEPLGIYAGKTATLADLKDGAIIAVPNDTTNEARALLLLEANGLIKLNPEAGIKATVNDITENPKNLKIVEIEAAQLPRSLQDVDIAVINGNYALEADLLVSDALAIEEKESLAATTYANIVAIRRGDETREDLQALAKAITSDEVKAFIEETYAGAVVPMF